MKRKPEPQGFFDNFFQKIIERKANQTYCHSKDNDNENNKHGNDYSIHNDLIISEVTRFETFLFWPIVGDSNSLSFWILSIYPKACQKRNS